MFRVKLIKNRFFIIPVRSFESQAFSFKRTISFSEMFLPSQFHRLSSLVKPGPESERWIILQMVPHWLRHRLIVAWPHVCLKCINKCLLVEFGCRVVKQRVIVSFWSTERGSSWNSVRIFQQAAKVFSLRFSTRVSLVNAISRDLYINVFWNYALAGVIHPVFGYRTKNRHLNILFAKKRFLDVWDSFLKAD